MDFIERFDSLERGDVLGWRDLHADLVKRDASRNSFLRRVSAKHGVIEEPDYFWVMLPTVVAATVTLIGVVASM
jgi:hypothetical protein